MELGGKPLLGLQHKAARVHRIVRYRLGDGVRAAHVCRRLGEGGSGSPPKTRTSSRTNTRTIEEGGIRLERQRRTFHEQRAKLRIIDGPWSQLSAKIPPQNLRYAIAPQSWFRQIPELAN
jgi:hypothetical protein